MSEDNNDDGSSVEDQSVLREYRWYIWGGLVGIGVLAIIGIGISQGALPNIFAVFSNPIIAGGLVLTGLVSLMAYGLYRFGYIGSEDFNFGSPTDTQLSSREAKELVKYDLWHDNIFISEVRESGIVWEGDEDEESRIFMMRYLDHKRKERGIVVSLEQDIKFDVEDVENHNWERCDNAVNSINDTRRFKADDVGSVENKFESIIESMAQTRDKGIVREEIDPDTGQVTGRVTRRNVETEVVEQND